MVMNENSGAWTRAVAAQIRAERAASGKTQREVITASGIPKSTYLRLESGERKADADQLANLSSVFGLRMSVFFQRVEDRVLTMSDAPQPAANLSDHITQQLSPEAKEQIAEAQRIIRERGEGGGSAKRLLTGQ